MENISLNAKLNIEESISKELNSATKKFTVEAFTLKLIKEKLKQVAGQLNNDDVVIEYKSDNSIGYYGELHLTIYASGYVNMHIDGANKSKECKFSIYSVVFCESVKWNTDSNRYEHIGVQKCLLDNTNALAAITHYGFNRIDANNNLRHSSGLSTKVIETDNEGNKKIKYIRQPNLPILQPSDEDEDQTNKSNYYVPTSNIMDDFLAELSLRDSLKSSLTNEEYQQIRYILDGFNDVEISERLNMKRTTWLYRKNKLLNKIKTIIEK